MRNAMGRILAVVLALLAMTGVAFAQAPTSDDQEVPARFSRALGVSLDKVVVHYYLVKNGGVIELAAKDANDNATISALQKYLQNQKELWEKGKETAVTEVHSKPPECAGVMRKLRNDITFYVAKTDAGAVLRMFSINEQARNAIQDYLKFEIAEHKTGDSPTIDQ
jgi:hypothetical protein